MLSQIAVVVWLLYLGHTMIVHQQYRLRELGRIFHPTYPVFAWSQSEANWALIRHSYSLPQNEKDEPTWTHLSSHFIPVCLWHQIYGELLISMSRDGFWLRWVQMPDYLSICEGISHVHIRTHSCEPTCPYEVNSLRQNVRRLSRWSPTNLSSTFCSLAFASISTSIKEKSHRVN